MVALDALSSELRETKGMSTFLRRAQVIRDRKAREQVPDVHGHGATSKKALYDRDDRKSGKAAPADDAAGGGAGWQARDGRAQGRGARPRPGPPPTPPRAPPSAGAAAERRGVARLIAQEARRGSRSTRAPRPRSSSARAPTARARRSCRARRRGPRDHRRWRRAGRGLPWQGRAF